eukprot:6335163-Alexandrium_andersonii.AAC.1
MRVRFAALSGLHCAFPLLRKPRGRVFTCSRAPGNNALSFAPWEVDAALREAWGRAFASEAGPSCDAL